MEHSCFACALVLVLGVAARERPHILHVVVDDLGWDDLGFRNSGQIHTPTMDAMAKNGVILDNLYTMPGAAWQFGARER